MNSPDLKQFIQEHNSLFWYTPEAQKKEISPDLVVETIFNYGDIDDIKSLVSIMGMESLTDVFLKIDGRKKLNYYPEVYNFFSILVKKYGKATI